MSSKVRLVLAFDPGVPSETRREIEHGLDSLLIDFSDRETNQDIDDKNTLLALIHETQPSNRATVRDGVIHAVLEAHDVSRLSTRWTSFLNQVGRAISRDGLSQYVQTKNNPSELTRWARTYSTDPLAELFFDQLDPTLRADTLDQARREVAESKQQALDRDRARIRAEQETERLRRHIAELAERSQRSDEEIQRMQIALESSVYSEHHLTPDERTLVNMARDAAWKARHMAAQAQLTAESDATLSLRWPLSRATYKGETSDRTPNGCGRMTFPNDINQPVYLGEFRNGQRHGAGVGRDSDGNTWTGEWRDDQAHGFGILTRPDGARLEGKVQPASPTSVGFRNLYRWPTLNGKKGAKVHTEARPQIAGPSPDNSSLTPA